MIQHVILGMPVIVNTSTWTLLNGTIKLSYRLSNNFLRQCALACFFTCKADDLRQSWRLILNNLRWCRIIWSQFLTSLYAPVKCIVIIVVIISHQLFHTSLVTPYIIFLHFTSHLGSPHDAVIIYLVLIANHFIKSYIKIKVIIEASLSEPHTRKSPTQFLCSQPVYRQLHK